MCCGLGDGPITSASLDGTVELWPASAQVVGYYDDLWATSR
jgi:hypothetical protein